MKFNNLSLIFGILFGVGLAILAYLNFILAIVLSFAGIDWFIISVFVFAVMALLIIISSFFARKFINLVLIMSCVSFVITFFTIIYLFTQNLFQNNVLLLFVYMSVLILGVLTTLFSFIAKKKLNITKKQL